MRVLQITRDFPPESKGGISTAVGQLARAQRASGLDVGVVSFDAWRPFLRRGPSQAQPQPTTQDGIRVLRVRAHEDLTAARAFASDFAPDLLHVHNGMLWHFTAGLRALLSVPAVKTAHVLQRELNRVRGIDRSTNSLEQQERALHEVDLILAPSAPVAETLREYGPAYAARVRVTPPGLYDSDRARAAVAGRKTGPLRRLLHVGRACDVKGTEEIYAAFAAALEAHPDATAVIAAWIPDSPQRARRWQRRFLERVDDEIAARVTFTEWLDDDAVTAAYESADILATASWLESFGLVIAEGQLHGLPVIATACGGPETLIEDGENGRLVPPKDGEALTDALLEWLDDPASALACGRVGARTVRERTRWDAVLPETLRAYDEVLSLPRREAG